MQSNIALYQGDCTEILPEIQAGSVDVIITDPPYSTPVVTAFGRKKVKNLGDLSMQNTYFRMIEKEFCRILKPNGRVFIFCDDKYYPVLFGIFYEWQNTSLVIWDKGKIGMGSPFRKQHELIFYASKDQFEFKKSEEITHYPSILKYKPVSEKIHGAQKPQDMIEHLLKGFTDEGDTVLDCFMGSGTTLAACVNTNRNGIGIEINANYFEIAKRRIEAAQQQMVMPL